MKRWMWWTLIMLVAIACWSLPLLLLNAMQAHAQTGANGTKADRLLGQPLLYYDGDSTRRAVTAGQGLPVSQTATAIEYYPDIINTITSGVVPGSASTSAAKLTQGWKAMALHFYALPSAGAVGYDSYAIQIRGSYLPLTDSTASFPAGWVSRNAVKTGVFVDTIGIVNNVTPDLDDGSVTFPKAFVQSSEQLLIEINVLDSKRGRVIQLVRNGEWWQYPYTTVRIRPLRGRDYAGAVLASADSTTVRKYRADLVRLQ